jgi:hypothetical protein
VTWFDDVVELLVFWRDRSAWDSVDIGKDFCKSCSDDTRTRLTGPK